MSLDIIPEREWEKEDLLAYYILKTAIDDLKNDKTKKEAWDYFNKDSDYFFSFSNICKILNVDEQVIYTNVKKYKQLY